MSSDTRKTTPIAVRITHELNERIDTLAARMNVTRSQLLQRIIRNGTDELAGIVDKCENPIINLGMKIAVNLAADADERQEIIDQLNAIADHRAARKQDKLPGLPA